MVFQYRATSGIYLNYCENVDSIGIPADTDLYVVFLKKKLYKKTARRQFFCLLKGLRHFTEGF